MTLQTSRIKLRRFNLADTDNMQKLESDPDVMKFTPTLVPQTREQTEKKLIAREEKYSKYQPPFGIWAAERQADNHFIGWFMLVPTELEFPEIGFMVVKSEWGFGFATEVAKLLITSAFSQNFVRGISARVSRENKNSIRVLEKLGFTEINEMTTPEGGTLKIFHLKK